MCLLLRRQSRRAQLPIAYARSLQKRLISRIALHLAQPRQCPDKCIRKSGLPPGFAVEHSERTVIFAECHVQLGMFHAPGIEGCDCGGPGGWVAQAAKYRLDSGSLHADCDKLRDGLVELSLLSI